MSLDTIVKVTISKQTSVPTRAGFGEGAFVSASAVFEGYIKVYADIDEIDADVALGLIDTEVQTAAQKYFGQDNAPPKFYVIKKGQDLPHVQLITFSGEFVTGNVINLDVDGSPIGPVAFNTDSDTTLQGLATAIAAEAGVATAVADTVANTILVTGANNDVVVLLANLAVTGGASQATGTISLVQYPDAAATYVESIARARLINDDFYVLTIESKDKADQEPVADAVQAMFKLFFGSTADVNAKDAANATDIISLLKAKSYDRSIILYSADAANHAELAWIGGQLPKDPGSITWAYKQLKGITVDTLSTTEKNAVLGKNGNVYTTIAGLNVTEEGKTVEGEYIDVMRGIDFIVARMQEAVFALLANNDKIPYTDQGIAMVENEMRAVLQLAVGNQIITEGYTISVPEAASVPVADKALRILKNMKFNATLAGAIHKAELAGTLTL